MGSYSGSGAAAGVDALSGGAPRTAFGKYNLFATLGRGGMADVYLAVARGPSGFNKLVVIKRMRSGLADDDSFKKMFMDEARLAARLNHPNIVHTYDVGEEGGVSFIAMEYLEGQPLNRVIKESQGSGRPLDQCVCARIVSEAAAGLHFAHELADYDGTPLGIVHRDVSPHNIFVTYEGQVKVVDFGIAKAALSSTQTEVGVLKGKVAYMSPEQAVSAPVDRRSDVFALGIVLWEMLTQQRLMTGETAASTLHRLLSAPIPHVGSVRSDVHPDLDRIVSRALDKDPDRRYRTAQEMRDALDSFIAAQQMVVRQDEIGRLVTSMFGDLRGEVRQQIQAHMSSVATAASTGELAALNAEALRGGVPPGGADSSSSHLLRLAGNASSSGIVASGSIARAVYVANSGPPAANLPLGAEAHSPAPRRSQGVLIPLLIVVVFLLGGALVAALLVLRQGRPADEGAMATTASPTVTVVEPGIAQAPSIQAPTTAGAVTEGPVITTGPVTTEPDTTPTTKPTAKVSKPSTKPHHKRPPKPSTKSTAQPESTAPATGGGAPGYLTLDTYPWTRVSLGGKSLGTTPLVKVELPAGTHTLKVENPSEGVHQTLTVTIQSGKTVSKRMAYK